MPFSEVSFGGTMTLSSGNLCLSSNTHKLFVESSVRMEKNGNGNKFWMPSSQVTTLSKSVCLHWMRKGHVLEDMSAVAGRYSITLQKIAKRIDMQPTLQQKWQRRRLQKQQQRGLMRIMALKPVLTVIIILALIVNLRSMF